jgi:hypothetical protein
MEQREGATAIRSLTLDEFAAIAAELDAGLDREEVLAKAGLSNDAWEAAQERWLAKLAADASQGKLQKSRRYLKLLETQKNAARAKAKQTRKKPEAPRSIPIEPPRHEPKEHLDHRRVPAAPPSPHADPATMTMTAGFEPAKWEPIPFRSPVPQPESAGPRTARQQSSPDLRALPFQSAPQAAAPQPPAPIPSPARAPIPAPAPEPAAATIDLTATLTGPLNPGLRNVTPFRSHGPPDSENPKTARPLQDKNRSALPFQSPQPAAQPRTASPAPPLKPPTAAPTTSPPAIDLSATLSATPDDAATFTAPLRAAPREAMPFRSAAPPPEPQPAARRSRDSSTDLRALPFQPAPPAAPPPAPPARPASAAPPPAPPAARSPLTQPVSPAARPPLAQPLSPAAPPPPALSEADRKRVEAITLNEYAHICATVRLHPDHIAWIRNQLHFNEAAWKALHTLWQERFAKSPELKERWQTLIRIKMRPK